jgi:hypothetical protein
MINVLIFRVVKQRSANPMLHPPFSFHEAESATSYHQREGGEKRRERGKEEEE